MAAGGRRPLLRQPEHPPLHRRGDRRGPVVHAELITLLLVPVFYSISVLDLKIVKWEPGKH